MSRILPLFLAAVLIVSAAALPIPPARAAISGCSASVSPHEININTGATLTFSVTNNDGSNAAVWIRINAPSSDYSINGGSASGWSRSIDSPTQVTFTGGSLPAGGSQDFDVQIQTGSDGISSQNWTVQIADSSDGSGAATCSGDTSTQITGDSTAPTITNVSADEVTSTTATITWDTDEDADSLVRYGTDTSYGSTITSGTLRTSHSLKLSGLASGTTYHYQVESTDASDNTATSDDFVFTTQQSDSDLSISNISATNISTTSATITWDTNIEADSQVDYGTDTNYGSTKADGTDTLNHSMELSGLSADTVYHYKVSSTDSTGTTVESSDNTFTTAKESTSDGGGDDGGGGGGGSDDRGGESGGSSGSDTTTSSGGESTDDGSGSGSSGGGGGSDSGGSSEPAADTSPPSVFISTDLSRPYAQAPRISGQASDNRAIAAVSYSTDGGRNWLPVGSVSGIGTTRAGFAFTPSIFEDGNYAVRVRARDAAGNFGFSRTHTLVIDQQAPTVGTSLQAVGPQLLSGEQDNAGVITGFDQRVTVSAIGGPTSVDIIARSRNGEDEQVFSLAQNPETGLWSGAISLAQEGEYDLFIRARDGANNKTERLLRRVRAVRGGQIAFKNGVVKDAQVTVYARDPVTNLFEPWSGGAFEQANPQTTGNAGTFQYLLPPGSYYLTVQADGFRPTQTNIFTIETQTTLRPTIEMARQNYIPLGPWAIPVPPLFWPRTISIDPGVSDPAAHVPVERTMPETFPKIPVAGVDGNVVLTSLADKPTIITFLSEWSPRAPVQVGHLEGLDREQVRALPVLVQSSAARAEVLKTRGRYTVPLFADETGELAAALGVDTTPTHIIVTSNGDIVDVVQGVKTPAQLQELIPSP